MKTLFASMTLAMSLVSAPTFASANYNCVSILTKSLKLFVNLSDTNEATLGVGSNVDPDKILEGTFTTFVGQPNTRLAGLKIVDATASGKLQEREVVAKVRAYIREDGAIYSLVNAEIGAIMDGKFEVFEHAKLKCHDLK